MLRHISSLRFERHRRVRGTRRRQSGEFGNSGTQTRQDQLPEQLFRGFAVEANSLDIFMIFNEFPEIVRRCRVRPDIGIHAAGTNRTGEHIPDRDALVNQLRAARCIVALNTEQFAHDFPERVLRVRVVLDGFERRNAGQAAQQQNSCIRPLDGRETRGSCGVDTHAICARNTEKRERRRTASAGYNDPTPGRGCEPEFSNCRHGSAGTRQRIRSRRRVPAREECEEVKVKIRAIEAKMRRGYTAAQGIRYEEKLRELKEQRYKLCQ